MHLTFVLLFFCICICNLYSLSSALVVHSNFLLGKRSIPRTCDFVLSESAADRNHENYTQMLQVKDITKDSFCGSSILLTGASGGLGKELALQLADCSVYQIVLSGRREAALKDVAQECQRICPSIKTHIVPCDLSDKDSVSVLASKAIELCGERGIDVLINNGGVSSRSDFVDTSIEIDERIMQINFFAGAALAKAVVPKMMALSKDEGKGKIIWISSVQGLLGIPSRTSYAASKFAVQGYCESLRSELASSGVSVHIVSPGYIQTDLSRSALRGDGTAHGQLDEATAKGRPPKEVAVSILDSVAQGQSDIVVAASLSAKVAIWLRFLFPSLLQSMLVKRFEKAKLQKEKMTTEEISSTRQKID